jgi:hypothetical protein
LHRKSLLKHVTEGNIEGKIEMTGRQGKRHKEILYDLQEMKVY